MNLKLLSNEVLDSKLQSLMKQERELLSEILLHIAEVDRRKLYLKMAYPNIFTYLTEHLGYSAGSAQRRIDAARLMNDVPDLPGKLESGELNLAQVSLVQKSIRQKKEVSRDVKQFLVEELMGLSLEDSQKKVAQALDLEIKAAPSIKHQKNESVRLEITLSKEQWQKLQQMRELLSTSLPNGSWDAVLEYVAENVIQQKTKLKAEPKPSANLTLAKKKFIFQRDQCCQHVDPITQKKCGSKWNLQVDHIQPKWAAGPMRLKIYSCSVLSTIDRGTESKLGFIETDRIRKLKESSNRDPIPRALIFAESSKPLGREFLRHGREASARDIFGILGRNPEPRSETIAPRRYW